MSIVRYDPFRDLRTLQEEVNRLFSTNLNRSFGDEGIGRGAWNPSVDIFAPLSADETGVLAQAAVSHVFAPGETVIRAGEPGSSMFVVHNGRVRVQINENGRPRTVATLNEGDFFGEMGMMTGDPRSATVIALSDVECYRVDKEAFHDIMQSRPEIAEDISEVLARRRVELDAAREDLNEEAKRARLRQHQGDLLNRIKHFFGL